MEPNQIMVTEIPLQEIRILNGIGKGSFGVVHRGIWKNKEVAIKKVETESEVLALQNEILQLSRTNHENIIKLHGAYTKGPLQLLVMEFADCGSLYQLLHNPPYPAYTLAHGLSWMMQCAKAVAYLHACENGPIIHRDLKPPNLLLSSGCRVLKVCDFGTACDLHTIMTDNTGSAAWMAPEVFETKNYGEKCDVYSWGIILWEVLTRRVPFLELGQACRIMWAVHTKRRPPLIKGCPQILELLMRKCWDHEPSARPSMEEILEMIPKITWLLNGQDDPIHFPSSPENSSSYVSPATGCSSSQDVSDIPSSPSSIHNNNNQCQGQSSPLPPQFSGPPLHDVDENEVNWSHNSSQWVVTPMEPDDSATSAARRAKMMEDILNFPPPPVPPEGEGVRLPERRQRQATTPLSIVIPNSCVLPELPEDIIMMSQTCSKEDKVKCSTCFNHNHVGDHDHTTPTPCNPLSTSPSVHQLRRKSAEISGILFPSKPGHRRTSSSGTLEAVSLSSLTIEESDQTPSSPSVVPPSVPWQGVKSKKPGKLHNQSTKNTQENHQSGSTWKHTSVPFKMNLSPAKHDYHPPDQVVPSILYSNYNTNENSPLGKNNLTSEWRNSLSTQSPNNQSSSKELIPSHLQQHNFHQHQLNPVVCSYPHLLSPESLPCIQTPPIYSENTSSHLPKTTVNFKNSSSSTRNITLSQSNAEAKVCKSVDDEGIITIGAIPCLGYITDTVSSVTSGITSDVTDFQDIQSGSETLTDSVNKLALMLDELQENRDSSLNFVGESKVASVKEIEWESLPGSAMSKENTEDSSTEVHLKSVLGPVILKPSKDCVAKTIGLPITRRRHNASVEPHKRHSSEYDEAYNKAPIITRNFHMQPISDETEHDSMDFEKASAKQENPKSSKGNTRRELAKNISPVDGPKKKLLTKKKVKATANIFESETDSSDYRNFDEEEKCSKSVNKKDAKNKVKHSKILNKEINKDQSPPRVLPYLRLDSFYPMKRNSHLSEEQNIQYRSVSNPGSCLSSPIKDSLVYPSSISCGSSFSTIPGSTPPTDEIDLANDRAHNRFADYYTDRLNIPQPVKQPRGFSPKRHHVNSPSEHPRMNAYNPTYNTSSPSNLSPLMPIDHLSPSLFNDSVQPQVDGVHFANLGGGESSVPQRGQGPPHRGNVVPSVNELGKYWELLDPETQPVMPVPGCDISENIFDEHKDMARKYLVLQQEIYNLLQQKKELSEKINKEESGQQLRQSRYQDKMMKLQNKKEELRNNRSRLQAQLNRIRSTGGAASSDVGGGPSTSHGPLVPPSGSEGHYHQQIPTRRTVPPQNLNSLSPQHLPHYPTNEQPSQPPYYQPRTPPNLPQEPEQPYYYGSNMVAQPANPSYQSQHSGRTMYSPHDNITPPHAYNPHVAGQVSHMYGGQRDPNFPHQGYRNAPHLNFTSNPPD